MARGRVISICNIFDFEKKKEKEKLLYFNKKSQYSTLLPNTLGLISLRKLHSMLRADYNAT